MYIVCSGCSKLRYSKILSHKIHSRYAIEKWWLKAFIKSLPRRGETFK